MRIPDRYWMLEFEEMADSGTHIAPKIPSVSPEGVKKLFFAVTPVKTGVQCPCNPLEFWIPAFAGMTTKVGSSIFSHLTFRKGEDRPVSPFPKGGPRGIWI